MKNKTRISLLIITVLIASSLLLSACGPSTNPDGSVDVEVTLTDFGIESTLDNSRLAFFITLSSQTKERSITNS